MCMWSVDTATVTFGFIAQDWVNTITTALAGAWQVALLKKNFQESMILLNKTVVR